jgi:asparagine synthase (glutamine-hydrolysing)
MCGIFGIHLADRDRTIDPFVLATMGEVLDHRGPDDRGLHVDRNVALGHRRLSIIDLSPTGHQPMCNEDGSLWIVYNGEIYNYLELREQLVARGHVFRSQSDTEVILHLYEDEGPDCVRRLNGMFAFAIWDGRQQQLYCARDRFGVKPFYYAAADGAVAFASEIKALLRTGLVSAEVDRDALADYLTFQFCLGDKTLFRGIRKLLPGHWMLSRADGGIRVEKYWDLDYTIDFDHTDRYFEERLRELLEDGVRIALRSDVPVGAQLSGGLDSSTVACLASSLLGSSIQTFTGSFADGAAYDETPYARQVAEHIGATHHEVFPVAQDFVDLMPRLIYHMDEPAGGPGVFPQYCVSELASRHVKVVLGGQGGDEIFAGYARYLLAYLEECIRGGIEGTQQNQRYVVTFESILPNLTQLQEYRPLLRHFWREGLFEPPDRRYFRLVDRSEDLGGLVAQEALGRGAAYQPFDGFCEVFNANDCGSLINKMTRFDIKTLLPALLHVEDRMSMAVSLESRVPLLDHRIVELVATMPPAIKYQGGRSKHVFRQVVRDIVPESIYARRDKMGFPVPLNEWYRRPPVSDFVRDVLLSSSARSRGFVRVDRLERMLTRERPYGRGIWGLLCLELWMQTFIDRSPGPPVEARPVEVNGRHQGLAAR